MAVNGPIKVVNQHGEIRKQFISNFKDSLPLHPFLYLAYGKKHRIIEGKVEFGIPINTERNI